MSVQARFHPARLYQSERKSLAVIALGIHPVTIIVFKILLSSAAVHPYKSDLGRWDAACRHFCVARHAPPPSFALNRKSPQFRLLLVGVGQDFCEPIAPPHIAHETPLLGLQGSVRARIEHHTNVSKKARKHSRRVKGSEGSYAAWEAAVLPFN